MNRLRLWLALAALGAPLGVGGLARAADHLDAPLLRPNGNGDRDINDVYVFQSPTNPANSVLVMTVNPFAERVNPFGSMSSRNFGSNVDYQLVIDNNGDALADVTYSTTFTAPVGNSQTFSVNRVTSGGTTAVVSGGTDANVAIPGGGMARAGLFDDPFFFDLVGFNNGFAFTGADTFAGFNTSAIVLEIPSSQLGAQNVGIYARTVIGGVQQDRMGRPAINTALIPSGMKDAFNAGSPVNDSANFGATVTASITGLSNAANAAALTPILLPDLLTYDSSSASGFLNGRRLADDVIDAELNLLSAGAVTGDGVNANDNAFLGVFPYLAAPNPIPEPATIAIAIAGLLAWGYSRRRAT